MNVVFDKFLFMLLVSLFLLNGCGGDSSDDEEYLGSEAFYTFDESEGVDVYNSMFNELHGVIFDSQRVEGKINGAISFHDNLPSYIRFPSTSPALNSGRVRITFPTNSMSIEAWVKFVELDPSLSYLFFGDGSSYGLSRFMFSVSNGQFRFLFNPERNGSISTELITSDYVFGVDTWYHIAFTYDGSVAKIYVNGELNAEAEYDATLYEFHNSLYLGGSDEFRSFPGYVDEFRFTETLRSAETIKNYYESTR